jgi:hypothetical protein
MTKAEKIKIVNEAIDTALSVAEMALRVLRAAASATNNEPPLAEARGYVDVAIEELSRLSHPDTDE